MPTFSPDGNGLAWHAGDGIHVAAVPSFGGDCTLDGATPAPPLVIPGGREPDWGPAEVPPARPASSGSTPGGGTVNGGGSGGKPGASNALAVKVLSATRSGGVKVNVKVAGKGKLTATAKLGKKVVGKASKSVKKAGTASLKVKVTRKGKATLKVTFKPSSGASSTTTVNLKIR